MCSGPFTSLCLDHNIKCTHNRKWVGWLRLMDSYGNKAWNKTSRRYESLTIKGSTRDEYLPVSKGISANLLRDRWCVTKKCGFMVKTTLNPNWVQCVHTTVKWWWMRYRVDVQLLEIKSYCKCKSVVFFLEDYGSLYDRQIVVVQMNWEFSRFVSTHKFRSEYVSGAIGLKLNFIYILGWNS